MGYVLPAKVVFSPLDEELALVPGRMTPIVHENLVRLGAWMPFEEAAKMLKVFSGAQVSEFTAR